MGNPATSPPQTLRDHNAARQGHLTHSPQQVLGICQSLLLPAFPEPLEVAIEVEWTERWTRSCVPRLYLPLDDIGECPLPVSIE